MASCEKQPFDYRTKYVGNYNFTTLSTVVDIGCIENNGTNCETTETIISDGKVSYGTQSNEIRIRYRKDGDWNFTAILDKNGAFTANPTYEWTIYGDLNKNGDINFPLTLSDGGYIKKLKEKNQINIFHLLKYPSLMLPI